MSAVQNTCLFLVPAPRLQRYRQVRQSDLQVRRFHDSWPVEMRFVKIIASA
jgi:hypothetical protein